MEKTYNKALDSAIQIGEYLISESICEKGLIYWLSWKRKKLNKKNKEPKYDFFPTNDFYSGNSGVAYFFLNLYKATSNDKYIEVCEKALDWSIYNMKKGRIKSGFYNGDYGVYLTASNFMKIRQTTKYKSIIDESLKNIKIDINNYDIISGHSGSILALLEIINDDVISVPKTLLKKHVEYLLNGIKFRNNLLAFEQDYEYPLSGFSHGQSGISYVFTELAYLTRNEWLYSISDSLYKYEDVFKEKNTCNYKDTRSYLHFQDNFNELSLKEVKDGLSKKAIMFGWCHGFPGIAMSRLNYYYRTGDENYLKQVEGFVDFYKKNFELINGGNISCLCHGDVGNIELLLQYAYLHKDDELIRLVRNHSLKIFTKLKKNGFINNENKYPNDFSIMGGVAGIGYYFLRLFSPNNFQSILLFGQNDREIRFHLEIDKNKFWQSFIKNNFVFSKNDLNKFQLTNLFPLENFKKLIKLNPNIKADLMINKFVSTHNLDYKHYVENKRQKSNKLLGRDNFDLSNSKIVSYNNFIIIEIDAKYYLYYLKNFNYFLSPITDLEKKILNVSNIKREISNIFNELEEEKHIKNFTNIIKSIISNGILFIN